MTDAVLIALVLGSLAAMAGLYIGACLAVGRALSRKSACDAYTSIWTEGKAGPRE